MLSETLKRVRQKARRPDPPIEFCDGICTRNRVANPENLSFPLQNGSANIPRIDVSFSNIKFCAFPRSAFYRYKFLFEYFYDRVISDRVCFCRFRRGTFKHGVLKPSSKPVATRAYSFPFAGLMIVNEGSSLNFRGSVFRMLRNYAWCSKRIYVLGSGFSSLFFFNKCRH
jgi:hypothetical protein